MQIKDSKSFGVLIKKYRKQQGLTQLRLAAVANTSPRFIGELEKGKPSIQLNKALHVAWLLGINLNADGDE